MTIAVELTGKESNPRAARKALYVAKQMNAVQAYAEVLMERAIADEKKSRKKIADIYDEREKMQRELMILLEEGKN